MNLFKDVTKSLLRVRVRDHSYGYWYGYRNGTMGMGTGRPMGTGTGPGCQVADGRLWVSGAAPQGGGQGGAAPLKVSKKEKK